MFELELIDGNREAAEALWKRCESLAPLWPEPNARHIYERPDWRDRRGIALTEAGHHLLGRERDEARRRGAALLDEALEWVEPRLIEDLSKARKADRRGFVYRTLYGNGLAAEMSGAREKAHAFYTRSRDVYLALVTTWILDDAMARTVRERARAEKHPEATALVGLLVQAGRIRLNADLPTPRLLEDVSRCLAKQPTAENLSELLVDHPDVDELFASDDDLERLLEEVLS